MWHLVDFMGAGQARFSALEAAGTAAKTAETTKATRFHLNVSTPMAAAAPRRPRMAP